MTQLLDAEKVSTIFALDSTQRVNYFFKESVEHNKLWILKDEHGCVMLNTEEEDCVPVWPHEEFAKAWATDEWQHCTAEAISLNKWFSRWTHGLADDDLAVVVFPSLHEEGLVFYSDELEFELKAQQKKSGKGHK